MLTAEVLLAAAPAIIEVTFSGENRLLSTPPTSPPLPLPPPTYSALKVDVKIEELLMF